MPLRLAFFGTPDFAVPTLERLLSSAHPVRLVVTQPDRPRGRGQHVHVGPVKAVALSKTVPVIQPARARDDELAAALEGAGIDLGVVAAYGQILPERLLRIPRLGMINVHASLLPRWRGAAPVHRAILAGDLTTGITIMRVVRALDAGPLIARAPVSIGTDESSESLERRLATLGAELLVGTVDRLAEGPLPEEPQDEGAATYAARLERRESLVDWEQPARVIHNRIRGLQPWPLAEVLLGTRRLLLRQSEVGTAEVPRAAPGTIVAVDRDALVVMTGDGTLRLTAVQPEGRPPMSVRDFLNGRRVMPGDVLGPIPTAP